MKRVLAVLAVCIVAMFAAAPSMTASAAPSESPPAAAHHYGQLRKGPVPGTQTSPIWSGYDVDSSATGKTMTEIEGSIVLPKIECSDTKIGSSGNAITDSWVGISAGPSNGALAQDGIESFCTGTPGHFGSCGNCGIGVWFYECCTGTALAFFSVPSNQIVAGNPLTFRTEWLPNATNCGQTGCYQFVVWWNGMADHQTKYLPCYATLVCGQSNTAEAITEAPGGGNIAVTPMVEYDPNAQQCLPCIAYSAINYDVTSVQSNDATGNLFSKTGEWTSNKIVMNLNDLPQVVTGNSTDGVGNPEPLGSGYGGGDSFIADCAVELANLSLHQCPYSNY